MRIERIADPADPRLAAYRDLRDPRCAAREGVFVAEGPALVRRLLAGRRFRARSVLATHSTLDGLGDVVDGVAVYVVDEATIRAVVGFPFHRGCLALGERARPGAVEPLLAGCRLVVLERVTDPDNVGAVFRNGAALGADGVLFSPGSADPLYRKAVRVSMGGVLSVPFATLGDWPAGLERLRAAGIFIVALTPDGEADLATLDSCPTRTALLLGGEARGLSAGARAAADVRIAIRMAPGDHSLNVATACAIALYHLSRDRRR